MPSNELPNCGDLSFERHHGVLSITINKPDEGNRLTPDALAALETLASQLHRDAQTQVVLVVGSGESFFSSGILNPVLRAAYSKEEIVELVRLANRAFNALDGVPQTVIGVLNGEARAGGAELALACDIRLAAESASMAFPEAGWGGFPGAGGPYRLATLVGRGRALELIGTGRSITAQEMERYGLIQAVYPSTDLHTEARRLATRLASAGPLALRGAKRIIRARVEPGLESARELSDALRHELEWSEDVDEAIAAHRENRTPRFVGR
jgi:enoyl-CoA hydratase/carnithine racemase